MILLVALVGQASWFEYRLKFLSISLPSSKFYYLSYSLCASDAVLRTPVTYEPYNNLSHYRVFVAQWKGMTSQNSYM